MTTGNAGSPDHEHAISHVLDALDQAAEAGRVSVGDVVRRLGPRSFAPLLLVPALIVASPASAVPGLTSIGALVITFVLVQMLAGRRSLWLPGFLARRSVSGETTSRAVRFLRRPVGAIEPHLRPRLTFLARRPGSYLPLIVCLAISMVMPFLELVPTAGSIGAVAIAIFATGLLMRDGALILAGLAVVAAGGGLILHLLR